MSPRDRPAGVGFTVDVGCTCAGVVSGVFDCGGGEIAGSEVGVAFDNAHPGTNAMINEIPMNFMNDFMTFFGVLLVSATK